MLFYREDNELIFNNLTLNDDDNDAMLDAKKYIVLCWWPADI